MQFIGIDVHKRIFTACILDENEKVVGEIIDAPTTEKGLDEFMRQYPPEDCRIVFENLGRAHFVFHYLWDRGYAIDIAHTGHGAMNEIANSNFKTDRIDAYKLALVSKDIWSGRKFIRRAHLSKDDVMRMKGLVRIHNQCGKIRDEMYLRILEYMSLHNIPEHPKYKDVKRRKYCEYLLNMNDPALSVMVNMMCSAI